MGFCAPEEEDFVEATKKGGEAGAASMAGFGEAFASPMGASTEAEVDAATKVGLVGAATSPMMVSMTEEDAAAMAGLVGTAASLMEALLVVEGATAMAGFGDAALQ
jgi:hypothetical protein